MEELDLEAAIKSDIKRYERLVKLYSEGRIKIGNLVKGEPVDTTKETERHLENVIRELQALLRDR